jgi:hypothetical protein
MLAFFLEQIIFGILRPYKLNTEEIDQIVKQAYNYLGRPYDFGFDYGNHSLVYCTELVGALYDKYVKFDYIEKGLWPFVKKQKQLVADNIFLSSDLQLLWYSENAYSHFQHIFMQKRDKIKS